MTAADVTTIAPFFIVRDIMQALGLYRDQLGFEVKYLSEPQDPHFALIQRGGAMIMLKAVEADPLPNATRDPLARWDAFVSVPDPDRLAAEFAELGVEFCRPVDNTGDGLRGFEIADADGYVLFFGSPRGGS